MKTIIIVAMTRSRLIGRAGRIPWHDAEDLKHFKRVTTGHAVLMGRRTFESIGKPLPGRRNIVITRKSRIESRESANQPASVPRGRDSPGTSLDIVHSFDDALRLCRERNEEKAFIIGGGQIYAQALSLADELVVTWIERDDVTGDTFFPEWDPAQWVEAPPLDPAFPRAVHYRRVHPVHA
jgi:dihydrofolate reductase